MEKNCNMLAHPSQRVCISRVNSLIPRAGSNIWRSSAPVHGHHSLTRNNRWWNPLKVSQRRVQEHPYSLVIVANATRLFTSSAPLSKKKDKSGKRSNDIDKTDTSPSSDPFDLTQLHNGITDALARFKDDLSKLRSGGRLNPEVIENVRVHLVKGSKETVKLGELAQVVPKGGRSVAIIVGEEDVSLNHLQFCHPICCRFTELEFIILGFGSLALL